MEHMAFGANKRCKDAHTYEAEFTKNGAYHNAFTSDTSMVYEAECARFEWERILELQRTAITAPLFVEDEFISERGNVKSELTGYLNVPDRLLWPRIAQELGEDTMTFPERLALLNDIKLSDIKEHYKRTHTAGNMRFVIAGDFARKQGRLEEMLNAWELPEGERLPIPVDELHSAGAFLIRRKDAPNLTFGLSTNVSRRLSDEEDNAMDFLNHILTGTLHSRILGKARKKGVVYGMFSDTSTFEHNSSWDFGAQANYKITYKDPTYINGYYYNIPYENIRNIYEQKITESKVKSGDVLDQEKLEDEVKRITELMQEKGYYSFNRDGGEIYFTADTLQSRKQVPLTMDILKDTLKTPYKQYTIGNVEIQYLEKLTDTANVDVKEYENAIIKRIDDQYKVKALWRPITLKKGEIYNQKNLDLTKRRWFVGSFYEFTRWYYIL
jgi:hypothetical protein